MSVSVDLLRKINNITWYFMTHSTRRSYSSIWSKWTEIFSWSLKSVHEFLFNMHSFTCRHKIFFFFYVQHSFLRDRRMCSSFITTTNYIHYFFPFSIHFLITQFFLKKKRMFHFFVLYCTDPNPFSVFIALASIQ